METGLDTHRFRLGDTVRFVKVSRSSPGHAPQGNFRIVGLLPEYLGVYQYRVQSVSDGHQRVVTEPEIASHL